MTDDEKRRIQLLEYENESLRTAMELVNEIVADHTKRLQSEMEHPSFAKHYRAVVLSYLDRLRVRVERLHMEHGRDE